MKFVQSNKYEKGSRKESFAIPFFEETDLRKQLEYIEAEEFFDEELRNEICKEKTKEIVIAADGSIQKFLFLYLGKKKNGSADLWKKAFQKFGKMANGDWTILLAGLDKKVVSSITEAVCTGGYVFRKDVLKGLVNENLFSVRDSLFEQKEEQVFTIIHDEVVEKEIAKGMDYGYAINYARSLGDLPNNYLHVKGFASYTVELAEQYGMKCEILGDAELKRLHCGGILSVNAGSSDEANLVVLTYQGNKEEKPTALVGKGVMFDSGGYHLKSLSGMDGMKYDMCGAANLLEVMEIAAKRKLPVHLIGIFPLVENVISPSACKMGDVITTMAGKTVEVYNTDAEGRLILCDAITYAVKKGAKRIIDLATLTYSAQAALGNEYAGIFSNEEEFYQEFLNHTKKSGEKTWRLPLGESYHKQLLGTGTADLMNYSREAISGGGGASVAACFLEEFTEEIPWIHLDVVGPAVNRKDTPYLTVGATGVMISTIAEYLEGETE